MYARWNMHFESFELSVLPPQSKMQQQQLVCVNKQKISLKWQKSSHNSEKFPTIRNYTRLHIRPNNFVDLILEKIPKVYVIRKAMNNYIITYIWRIWVLWKCDMWNASTYQFSSKIWRVHFIILTHVRICYLQRICKYEPHSHNFWFALEQRFVR